ncbi:glycoside hydrolase family 3 N-terminal domain-containing protein [Millisia brevis]|uniref:glycoside hydrolase family 3 N-terminal domain-containing protein n=1 Tax=Millisia brevis TaxID=264148 RepID=UPI00082B77B0|nr:glycoside hydrolase family 3 N-terminal domain-containing protein [Millisia brevis]
MRISVIALWLVAVVTIAGCGSTASTSDPSTTEAAATETTTTAEQPATGTAGSVTPVAQQLNACQQFVGNLPLRRKLAQLLTVGVTDASDAGSVVSGEQVGGIFVGSWTDLSMLTNGALAGVVGAAPIAPFVTVDEEGGRVSRLSSIIGTAPAARVLPQQFTPEEVYQQAFERGTAMRQLGITIDFAPVVDVSSQADNTVIGDRSFSADLNVVTQYATQYANGLRDAGIMPVLKHFPGHGSASGDSHLGGVSTPPLAQMQTVDLVPYRAMVPTAQAVMIGHLDVPGLTGAGQPASISPAAMSLLRDGIGYGAAPFDGLIFTDDLSGMQAMTDLLSVPDAVTAALVAGADVALWITTAEVSAVLDRLEQAVASGELSMQRVDASMTRVARAKGVGAC